MCYQERRCDVLHLECIRRSNDHTALAVRTVGNVLADAVTALRRIPETGSRTRFPALVFGPRIPDPRPEYRSNLRADMSHRSCLSLWFSHSPDSAQRGILPARIRCDECKHCLATIRPWRNPESTSCSSSQRSNRTCAGVSLNPPTRSSRVLISPRRREISSGGPITVCLSCWGQRWRVR